MTSMEAYEFHLTIPASNYAAALKVIGDYAEPATDGPTLFGVELDLWSAARGFVAELCGGLNETDGIEITVTEESATIEGCTGMGEQWYGAVGRIRNLLAVATIHDWVRVWYEDDGGGEYIVRLEDDGTVRKHHPTSIYTTAMWANHPNDVERVREAVKETA